jgi:hypothetical protein
MFFRHVFSNLVFKGHELGNDRKFKGLQNGILNNFCLFICVDLISIMIGNTSNKYDSSGPVEFPLQAQLSF